MGGTVTMGIVEIDTEEDASVRTRPRVLLVDDDTTIRDVVGFMLERLDYSSVTVTSGREALDAIMDSTFEIVLMDVNMPEMDGIEATRRIRAEVSNDHQPLIIAMTANSSFADELSCIGAGMNYFLPKPIRMAHLAAALESGAAETS
jgi:CheY-like chemotaxis protein